MATSSPKHLATETPAETIGRLAREFTHETIETIADYRAFTKAVLDTLARIRDNSAHGLADKVPSTLHRHPHMGHLQVEAAGG